ncbi:hypothetical protein llap_13343 [Limosa lapponica baueri]|uniref:Uncharacterized protein n=1 Tax=Limosa lapponica baueri TaxID=1758121 RepID=A0A2I0TRC4_LIMLA|nr:hypothetical protein llap_13343 [Limosa lapponica baueri]
MEHPLWQLCLALCKVSPNPWGKVKKRSALYRLLSCSSWSHQSTRIVLPKLGGEREETETALQLGWAIQQVENGIISCSTKVRISQENEWNKRPDGLPEAAWCYGSA